MNNSEWPFPEDHTTQSLSAIPERPTPVITVHPPMEGLADRELGFYWVLTALGWNVSERYERGWIVLGSAWDDIDADFKKIGPRIIPPDEG